MAGGDDYLPNPFSYAELLGRVKALLRRYHIYMGKKTVDLEKREPYFYSCNSTVMVHIRKLRVKIEKDPKNPGYIKTVWGKGYKFDAGSK